MTAIALVCSIRSIPCSSTETAQTRMDRGMFHMFHMFHTNAPAYAEMHQRTITRARRARTYTFRLEHMEHMEHGRRSKAFGHPFPGTWSGTYGTSEKQGAAS